VALTAAGTDGVVSPEAPELEAVVVNQAEEEPEAMTDSEARSAIVIVTSTEAALV